MGDVLIKDGVMRPISPMNGRTYTLQEMQQYVGGYIETVVVGKKVMVMDEEGKLKNKLPNHIATGMLIRAGHNDWVAGDVMLIDRNRIE